MFEEYKDVVGIDELMEMLSIGKNKAYELINSRQIKSFKVGKIHKIPKKCIVEYVNHFI